MDHPGPSMGRGTQIGACTTPPFSDAANPSAAVTFTGTVTVLGPVAAVLRVFQLREGIVYDSQRFALKPASGTDDPGGSAGDADGARGSGALQGSQHSVVDTTAWPSLAKLALCPTISRLPPRGAVSIPAPSGNARSTPSCIALHRRLRASMRDPQALTAVPRATRSTRPGSRVGLGPRPDFALRTEHENVGPTRN
jgi:hypothetical protein